MSPVVNEIFYSLQGEGGRAGQASIFIRLAKCNLACDFCDTDFASGKAMSVLEILEKIRFFGCKWIIWTGGEPTLQLTGKIVDFFKKNGYLQAIETNGTNKVPAGIDYIACSPKRGFETVKNLIPEVDELRFPMKKGDLLPDISILPKAKRYLLSPIFDGQNIVRENVDYCVELIKQNPQWGLSLQMHKLIDIQ
jgi:organic radical activating enzyme